MVNSFDQLLLHMLMGQLLWRLDRLLVIFFSCVYFVWCSVMSSTKSIQCGLYKDLNQVTSWRKKEMMMQLIELSQGLQRWCFPENTSQECLSHLSLYIREHFTFTAIEKKVCVSVSLSCSFRFVFDRKFLLCT